MGNKSEREKKQTDRDKRVNNIHLIALFDLTKNAITFNQYFVMCQGLFISVHLIQLICV